MKFKLFALSMAFGVSMMGQVTLSTNMPSSLPAGSNTEVEVRINKGSIANFAKYQMDVPVGVNITEIDSKSGNFTFENNRAKIVWVSVPSEAEFSLKFKVSVTSSAPSEGAVIQKFYFLENGAKKEIEAEPMNVAFGGSANPKNLSGSTTQPAKTEPAKTTQPVATNPPKTEPAKTEPVPTKTEPKVAEPVNTNVANTNTTPASTGTPGLIYRVQLASSPTDPGKSKYAALGSGVEISKEDGQYKVLYGKYNTKEEGLKGFEEASAKGFKGFLVKYQNGVRVK